MRLGNHTVPGVWRFMLPYELQTFRIPEERAATCERCPRIHTDDYRPDYRCCTYYPRIPNFLLGMALRDDKAMVSHLQTLADEGWLLPEGFQATPQTWAVFLEDTGEDRFGKSKDILCPFLVKSNGFCSLYAFRNSVCSTFFCVNDCGTKGHNFWNSLQDIVVQVEMGLSQFVMDEIGFSVDDYNARLNSIAKNLDKIVDKKTGRWNKKTLKFLWGDRYGHEVETYQAMAHVIEENRDDLWEIACSIPLKEATKFERAGYEIVPEEYRDELDEDDYNDEAEAADPRDLWSDLQRTYRKMWKVPDGRLVLSPRVQITKNLANDPLGASYPDRPAEINFAKRKGGKTPDWREFVSAEEAEALRMFATPLALTTTSAEHLRSLCSRPPEQFVAEWYGKKVLIEE